jgi:hypothetical protein
MNPLDAAWSVLKQEQSDDPQEEAWAHLLDERGMTPRLNIPRKPASPPAQQGGRQLTQSDKHSMISEAKMKPISMQLGRGEKAVDPYQSDIDETQTGDDAYAPTPEEMLELYGVRGNEHDEESILEEKHAQEWAQRKFDEERYGRGRLDSTLREHGLV